MFEYVVYVISKGEVHKLQMCFMLLKRLTTIICNFRVGAAFLQNSRPHLMVFKISKTHLFDIFV